MNDQKAKLLKSARKAHLLKCTLVASLVCLTGCSKSDTIEDKTSKTKPATSSEAVASDTTEKSSQTVSIKTKGEIDKSYLQFKASKTAIGNQRKNKLNANYHFNKANSLREKRKFADAIAEYKRAIRAYPKDGAFYKNLGGTFAMVGKFEDAEAVLSKGTEISPDDWLMWNNLAVVLQQLNKKDECVVAIKKSMTLKPPKEAKEQMAMTLEKLESKN